MNTALLPERISKKIAVDTDTGCWNWAGYKTDRGYGGTRLWGRTYRAHRLVYELLVGPIPTNLQCDHLCRNRGCVNPSHIEIVTCRTNVLRGIGPTSIHAKKTHCPAGHPYSEDNTYRMPNNGRRCRECSRKAVRKYKNKLRLLRGLCEES